jgi:hypothetical protein
LAAAVRVLESLGPGAREILMNYYVNGEDRQSIQAAYGLTDAEFLCLRRTARESFDRLRRTTVG